MNICLEFAPRCAWHTDCPVKRRITAPPPMKPLADWLTIEDGAVLRGYECTVCGEVGYAGIDSQRRHVTRAGADRAEWEGT